MTLARFHVPLDLYPGARGALDERQTQQVRSVLRLRVGASFVVFDGSGVEGTATLTTLKQSGAQFEVTAVEEPDREPPLALTVGLALLRGDHFEIAVQKLTELGVRRLVPLAAERCVVSYDVPASWEKRADRYRRIVREAAEQSERVTLLDIATPLSPAAFFERERAIALVERSDAPSISVVPLAVELAIAIGPEGGWAPAELRSIERAAGGSAALGQLILRAETAAVAAAATLLQRAWTCGAAHGEPAG
jgi:16S rRNA (uracil1498-N3)-methyltransferase